MADKKKDPYETEKKPPVISHIAGRRTAARRAFGDHLPRRGGPITGRPRSKKGIEPPSPVKPDQRRPADRGAPTKGDAAGSGDPNAFKTEKPDHVSEESTLRDGTTVIFDGSPRKLAYQVFVRLGDGGLKCIGAVARTEVDSEKMRSTWEARNGDYREEFATRGMAALALVRKSS